MASQALIPPELANELKGNELEAVLAYVRQSPPRTQLAACIEAGYAHPDVENGRVFARPRVKSALTAALQNAGGTPDRIANALTMDLENKKNWQARLRSAEDCARIMGEFSNSDEKNASGVGMTFNMVQINVQANPDSGTRVSGLGA